MGDVDLAARTLTVWQTRVGRAQTSDGKSRRSRLTLASDSHTVDSLAQRLHTLEEEHAAFGPAYREHHLLFCWPDGRPLHPDTITEQFNRLVDRAGVPSITLHDVRHTYATMSLRAGVKPKIVSAHLGHATVAFTLDTYTEDVLELHHAPPRRSVACSSTCHPAEPRCRSSTSPEPRSAPAAGPVASRWLPGRFACGR